MDANFNYGDTVYGFYDLLYPPIGVSEVVDDITARYPEGARIVDFGVGTGRTAIPLALAGHDVLGIDISESMLEVLRDKDPSTLVRTECQEFCGWRGRC